MKNTTLIFSLAVATAAILPAQAIVTGGSVTSGGGTFHILTPPILNPFGAPNSVGNDTFQNNNLYAFNEDQNVVVGPGALAVDYVPGGGSGSIAAGTVVASHYVFYDPQSGSQTGYVDFDANILAIISSTGNLLASDYLANTGINYLNPAARGLEPGDSATIDSILANRMNVDWTASTPGDYVRVLTAFSPGAPTPDGGSGALLLGMGALGLMGLRRRKA